MSTVHTRTDDVTSGNSNALKTVLLSDQYSHSFHRYKVMSVFAEDNEGIHTSPGGLCKIIMLHNRGPL